MTLLPRLIFLLPLIRMVAAVAGLGAMIGPCRADSRYMIDVWTPYEGLPQSRVLSIAQTPDGYLWISTQLGWLARFDGIRFTHFSPANTPELLSPEIQKLQVDGRGVLWIADVDGRLISHSHGIFESKLKGKPGFPKRVTEWLGHSGKNDLFVTASGALLQLGAQATYENQNNPPPPKGKSIEQFYQDATGVLWCRTSGGILGRWADGRFQPEAGQKLPDGAKVNHFLGTPEGDLWLATDDGLWKRGKEGTISREIPADDKQILQLARNPDGSLWLRTLDAVILVRDGVIVHRTPLPEINAAPLLRSLEMHADSKGGVWILKHGGGVWQVDGEGVLTVLSTGNGLPSDLVEAWFEDREKNIWLGTAAGLVRLRPRWFQTVAAKGNAPGSAVVSICEDTGGDIWLGRADGLTRWKDGKADNISLPALRPNIPLGEITVTPGDSADEVWLGTVQSGAMKLRDGKITHPFPYPAPGLAIRVIRKDPEGGIWFGGEFGLFRWDGTKLRKFNKNDGLSRGHIFDISFDSKGIPWIAKADDLLVVYRNGRFEPVPLPEISTDQRIYTVLCGAQGNVWLGTVGGGLLQLSGGKLLRFTTEDGLPGNSVTQLLEDDDGYLWGGTQQGIFRVSTLALDRHSKNPDSPVVFQKYGHSDGLPTAEYSGGLQPACWKTRDGRLWFSTSACAVMVDPKKVSQNLMPPTVILERMELDEKNYRLDRQRDDPARHLISPGLHRYEFHFTGINFTAPERIGFQWQLSGVDTAWVDGHDQREVAYSGLAPGDYRFAVRASNNDGVWSDVPAVVAFRVQPYFWQRPIVKAGFILTGLILVSLMIAGFMRRKHFREMQRLEYGRTIEQQRFRHKQAMASERSRIAAELHDDLGANLTQIQWLTEAVTRGQSPPSGENQLLLRVSRKTHEMVRLIDQIVWAVNPKNDTLEQLVTYVCNFAEQFFRDSPTRCRIDVAGEIPAHTLEADVRHHLFLVAKEALHNVAKHAATDRVWVRATYEEGVFKLVIEDRGRGFDPTTAKAGDGLANMRHRAQSAGAELEIETTPGNGTQVVLLLKLKPQPA